MRKNMIFSDYLKYRAKLRGFDLTKIEDIVRYSEEKYFDTISNRRIAIGKHDKRLVMISYEESDDAITPVTIHAITRQQIKFRLKTGRFIYE